MPKKANTSRNYFAKQSGDLAKIKWGESYTSLFLGAVVVLVAVVLVFSFLKSKNLLKNTGSSSTTVTNEQSNKLPRTYVVKAGEDLWNISQAVYGSGYNWVDVAKANKLSNPNVLYVGTKLTLPNVKTREITKVQNSMMDSSTIKGTSYKVVKGDYLWTIAVRAYGDGYKWVDVAKANKLSNPDVIHAGNTLRIPRP